MESSPPRPHLVLSESFSSNPMSRWIARLQVAAYGFFWAAVLVACVCLNLVVLWRDRDLRKVGEEVLYGVFAVLLVSWIYFYGSTMRHRARRASVARFFDDWIVWREAPLPPAVTPVTHRVDYADIGHLELRSPRTVSVSCGSMGGASLSIPLSRYTVEDEFDHVEAFLLERQPGRLFSVLAEGDLRYSRAFTLVELLPEVGELTSGWIRIPDRRETGTTLGCCHRDWIVNLMDGGVEIEGAAGPLFRVGLNQVRMADGLIVARITSASRQCQVIEFGTGETWQIDREGELTAAGTDAGQVASTGERIELVLSAPVPGLVALVVLVAALRRGHAAVSLL